ncbi:MAG: S8 family serine peptidase, partial [Clostridia bacterium]|nr:S8 family serine peptidase [Clostridia bacterium]
MKKVIYALVFLIVILLASTSYVCADFDETTVIAVVKPSGGSFSLSSLSAPFGNLSVADVENLDQTDDSSFSLFSVMNEPQVYRLTLTEGGARAVLDAIEYLNGLDTIEYASPNYIYRISETVNDPYYSTQYSLPKVGAPAAWDMDIDCSSVTVAVIDSGCDMDHPDLTENIWTNPNEKKKTTRSKDNDGNGYKNDLNGWDFVNSDADPDDDNGHGTHVSGIISAVTNNSAGVASLARNAKIVPLKVMDASGQGNTEYIYKAIKYAAKMK